MGGLENSIEIMAIRLGLLWIAFVAVFIGCSYVWTVIVNPFSGKDLFLYLENMDYKKETLAWIWLMIIKYIFLILHIYVFPCRGFPSSETDNRFGIMINIFFMRPVDNSTYYRIQNRKEWLPCLSYTINQFRNTCYQKLVSSGNHWLFSLWYECLLKVISELTCY